MVADVSPGGMHTGITHPRCFASADANCSIHISKEHVVSATLLRQFALNGWAKISGLRWQKEKTFDLFPVKRLASKVLCTRHNSALSPLDAEIDDFSRVVGEIDRSIGKADFRDYVISGDNIQLWMLKTVIGMSEADYIGGSIRPGCIDILYGRREWPNGWGMYWRAEPGQRIYISGSFLLETQINPQTQEILFVDFQFRGLSLALSLGVPAFSVPSIYRPSGVTFRVAEGESHIRFQWDSPPVEGAVVLDRVGTYNGPSPAWQTWEQEG